MRSINLRTFVLAGFAVIATALLAVQAQVPGVNSTLNAVFTLAYDNSTMKPTYSATSPSLASPNNGGDVCSLYGSSTKVVKVRRAFVSAFASALQTDPISVIKRSTISNGGTVTAGLSMPAVAYDSNNSAATATTDIYTTVPTTPGTFVGTLIDVFITIAGATTSVANPPTRIFDWGVLGSPIVLRSANESVNISTAGLAAITMTCGWEWTEE